MSDRDSKRYYWLKLQKDFFKRHDIRIVESMPNGKDYILFYLKLLCESTSHNGELRFSETIPYNEEMLSTITNTNVDIVRQAIKIFEELNMIEIYDDGTLYLSEIQKMIGSETGQTIRKKQAKIGDNNQKILIETKKRTRFVPPSLDEIKTYIKEKNFNIDAQKFFDYYTTGNWEDSKGNKVKNWKQKLITWNKNPYNQKIKEEIVPTYDNSSNIKVDKEELIKMQKELFK